MKLYYAPGACSLGIHILLEEIGEAFETERLSLRDGDQSKSDFVAMNPKARVPVLVRDDGSILTEYNAISLWLARTHPASKFVPADADGEARAVETMSYVVGTVHGGGFRLIFRPESMGATGDVEHVREIGRENVGKGLAILEATVDPAGASNSTITIADAALFYVERWATATKLGLPPKLAAHFEAMRQRPAVKRALATEGLA